MFRRDGFLFTIAALALVVGLATVVVLGAQPSLPTAVAAAQPTRTLFEFPTATATETPTPVPTATPTIPIAPLSLPDVPVPAGGQVYMLTPTAPEAVGWVREPDEMINHLGDYSIYSGWFENAVHIGAIQFDLSAIPPGVPIIHADVTLTGLSDDWLDGSGSWTIEMLEPWMDDGWMGRDFHWLARPDSKAVALNPSIPGSELSVGSANSVFFPPEGLPLLEARLYSRRASFRVVGPQEGTPNVFIWDTGYGAGSLGRGPILRIVAGPAPGAPPPSPTPRYVIITPIPQDEQLLALAAQALAATAQAAPLVGDTTPTPLPSATPLPPNWVTPVIIVPTEQPENGATAQWQAGVATAQAIVVGTATPWPPNAWTATPTAGPTATRDLIPVGELTATPTPTVTPTGIPPVLQGRILFMSDRTGDESLMVMDADGSNVSLWAAGAGEWIYQQVKEGEDLSADGRFQVVVSAKKIDSFPDHSLPYFHLFVTPLLEKGPPQQLTQRTELHDMSYDPVWSPTDYLIAFVSASSGNDEIYTVRPDGSELKQLTVNTWEWDKHPSWSPDGKQIVFWSNRDTRLKQIWVMNADGSGQRNLSSNEYNDWDPVWVK